jgi:hypothetical protein
LFELRLDGKVPERRGYHATFQVGSQIFIYGGNDIREGPMRSMWYFDLAELDDLGKTEDEKEFSCKWE